MVEYKVISKTPVSKFIFKFEVANVDIRKDLPKIFVEEEGILQQFDQFYSCNGLTLYTKDVITKDQADIPKIYKPCLLNIVASRIYYEPYIFMSLYTLLKDMFFFKSKGYTFTEDSFEEDYIKILTDSDQTLVDGLQSFIFTKYITEELKFLSKKLLDFEKGQISFENLLTYLS